MQKSRQANRYTKRNGNPRKISRLPLKKMKKLNSRYYEDDGVCRKKTKFDLLPYENTGCTNYLKFFASKSWLIKLTDIARGIIYM